MRSARSMSSASSYSFWGSTSEGSSAFNGSAKFLKSGGCQGLSDEDGAFNLFSTVEEFSNCAPAPANASRTPINPPANKAATQTVWTPLVLIHIDSQMVFSKTHAYHSNINTDADGGHRTSDGS